MFHYYKIDINSLLPHNWVQDILKVAFTDAKTVLLHTNSITSRELDHDLYLKALTVDGTIIKEKLPWLYELYLTKIKKIGEQYIKEKVFVAKNPLYAINLNVQKGRSMRYECHVDSNPLQGVLYVTTHQVGEGGELIVSNDPTALGEEQIKKDAEVIYPQSGFLYFFNATKNPHFVKELSEESAVRVAIAMNFYTESSTEDDRPNDLNNHLFGK